MNMAPDRVAPSTVRVRLIRGNGSLDELVFRSRQAEIDDLHLQPLHPVEGFEEVHGGGYRMPAFIGKEDVGDVELGARHEPRRAAPGIAGQQGQHAGSVQIVARHALLRPDSAVVDPRRIVAEGRMRSVNPRVDDADFQVTGACTQVALPAYGQSTVAAIRTCSRRSAWRARATCACFPLWPGDKPVLLIEAERGVGSDLL